MESCKTTRSKQKYINAKGRFITCKVCGHEFKHPDAIEREKWIKKKLKCPKCKELYCNKPNTERQLMNLQDLYLASREEKYMNEMVLILFSYTESILKKHFSFYIKSPEQLEYFRDKTVSFVVEDFYVVKKNYRIWGSWAGIIDKKIRQSLFEKNEKLIENLIKDSRKEEAVEVNSINYGFEDGHLLTVIDPLQELMMESIDKTNDKALFIKFFVESLHEFSKRYTNHEMLKLIAGINLRLQSNDGKVLSFYRENGKEGKWAYLRFASYLKKRMKDFSF